MSNYLEIPKFTTNFRFRTFSDDGFVIVYPHFHKEIEIIYAQNGTVNIGIEDNVIELQEGEIYFFASGQAHYFLASPESERLVYQFDLNLFDEALLQDTEHSLTKLFEEGEPHSKHWSESLRSQTKPILTQLFNIEQQQPPGKKYLTLGLLQQMIGLFYQELPKRTPKKTVIKRSKIRSKDTLDRLNQAFDYIEHHYQKPISIDEVARVVGYSPYYFTRFFKGTTGQTFMQFLTDYRINQAKFILANEKLPMIEVAERAGFSSVKTFHHVFKKIVGLSPLQYQKSLIE